MHSFLSTRAERLSRRVFLSMMIQLGLSIGLVRQSQSAGGSSHTASVANFSRDRLVFDSGAQLGQSTAYVPVSGATDAPDGAVIQARAVSVDDGGATSSAWQNVSTAAGGAWFGTLQAPRNASWYRAEVRVKASTGAAQQTVNRFAAGHVWALWEQSNWAKLFYFNSTLAPLVGTVAADHDVQFVRAGTAAAGATIAYVYDGAPSLSPAMVDMANALNAHRPGEKFAIACHVVPGTSMGDAMTSGAEDAAYSTAGGRDWDDEARINAAIVPELAATGRHVGAVFDMGWISVYAGTTAAVNETLPIFIGKDRHGAVVTPASYAFSPTTGGLPRTLPLAYGGFYDYAYARHAWGGPHGRVHPTVAAAAVTTVADYSVPPSGDPEYDALIGLIDTTYGSAALPETLPFIGQTAGAERGTSDNSGGWTDQLHMNEVSADGRGRLGRLGMAMNLKTLGLVGWDWPSLNGRLDDASGAYVDFWVAGRNLTTERLRRGEAAMPAIAPHRTDVLGWTINSVPVTRAEIVTGAGPAGEDVCRVWPITGSLTYGDNIQYGYGSLPGHYVDEDFTDLAWKNWLVCDVGQADLPALPVQFRSADALATTLPTPVSFTVAGATTFRSPTKVMNGRTSVRAEVIGKLYSSGGRRQGLSQGHTNFQFYRQADDTLALSHSAGTLRSGFTILNDVVHKFVGVVDLVNDNAYIEIDGVRVASQSGLGSSISAFTNREFSFLVRSGGTDKAHGTFESLKLWFNDADGLGTPFKTVAGGATTVNADKWHSGTDAI